MPYPSAQAKCASVDGRSNFGLQLYVGVDIWGNQILDRAELSSPKPDSPGDYHSVRE